MKIIVLVKHACLTDYRPNIGADGKSFDKESQTYEMNEYDGYALAEAVKIRQKIGGEVVAVSIGKDCDDTLRRCFALGADRTIKVPFDSMDSRQIAEVIYEVVKGEAPDLVLAGFQSQDLNNGLVGPLLAGLLDWPYVTAVISTEFENDKAIIRRELEAGYREEDEVLLPCVLTVQTGINEPKYPSIMAIRKAMAKKIEEISVTVKPPTFEIKKLYFPKVNKGTAVEGTADEINARLVEVIKERGLL